MDVIARTPNCPSPPALPDAAVKRAWPEGDALPHISEDKSTLHLPLDRHVCNTDTHTHTQLPSCHLCLLPPPPPSLHSSLKKERERERERERKEVEVERKRERE